MTADTIVKAFQRQKFLIEEQPKCRGCGGELKLVQTIPYPEISLFKCVACGVEEVR